MGHRVACTATGLSPSLHTPTHAAGIVFDETHFGRFTNQYTRGEYYFDMYVAASRCCRRRLRRPRGGFAPRVPVLILCCRSRPLASRHGCTPTRAPKPDRPLRAATRRWARSSSGSRGGSSGTTPRCASTRRSPRTSTRAASSSSCGAEPPRRGVMVVVVFEGRARVGIAARRLRGRYVACNRGPCGRIADHASPVFVTGVSGAMRGAPVACCC